MQDINLLGTSDNITYGNNNDISYDSKGKVVLLSLTDKLKQDITKILITEIGEHKVFSGYGSNLQTLINSNIKDENIKRTIVNSIIYAFSYLNQNNNSPDPEEKIKEIQSIDVRYDATDARKIYVRVQLINNKDEEITITLGG